jgi:hypothetical protein
MKTIELGDLVRDKVTGFSGVVTAKTQFLSGCDRVSVQPTELKEGAVRSYETFDVLQLEILEKSKVVIEQRVVEDRTGGPRPDMNIRPGQLDR